MKKLAALTLVMIACSAQAASDRIKFSTDASTVSSTSTSSNAATDTLMVSDRDLNRFVFSSPVKRVIFPAGAPVLGQPIYLSGNTQVLVQVAKGSDSEFAMIVEGENGKVVSLRLSPRPVAGAVHRIDGARDLGAVRTSMPKTDTDSEGAQADDSQSSKAIRLLADFAMQAMPVGFEPQVLPKPVRFDKFTVIPLEVWSDGAYRITRYSLIAVPGQSAVVSQPQFYRDGVLAISLDGNVVDSSQTPILTIVDEEAGN